MIDVKTISLEGKRVVLRPLQREHVQPLAAVALDDTLWVHTSNRLRSVRDVEEYVNAALSAQASGSALPFLTTLTDGTVVGSTRFGNIDISNQRVEIGWTWIAKPWQRTFVNTEAKYLQLRHAFEVWKCERVEFKTGTANERSRAAMLRLGAREEGILRRHIKLHDGSYRDTVYYSILSDEWPDIRDRLEALLT